MHLSKTLNILNPGNSKCEYLNVYYADQRAYSEFVILFLVKI